MVIGMVLIKWEKPKNAFFDVSNGNSRFSLGAGLNFTFLKTNDAFFDYAVVVEPHSVSQGLIHVFTYAFNF